MEMEGLVNFMNLTEYEDKNVTIGLGCQEDQLEDQSLTSLNEEKPLIQFNFNFQTNDDGIAKSFVMKNLNMSFQINSDIIRKLSPIVMH